MIHLHIHTLTHTIKRDREKDIDRGHAPAHTTQRQDHQDHARPCQIEKERTLTTPASHGPTQSSAGGKPLRCARGSMSGTESSPIPSGQSVERQMSRWTDG